MYDGSAIAMAELRFREDLWRTAPSDAVEEAAVEYRRFGPLLATVFGELPDTSVLNVVQGAAELERGRRRPPGEGGRMAADVGGRLPRLGLRRPSRHRARRSSGWRRAATSRGATVRRYVHTAPGTCEPASGLVEIRKLGAIDTEGMSHIFADVLDLPNLSTVLMIGLPRWEGWSCYAAHLEGREVACGSMLIPGKVALFGLDATLPDVPRPRLPERPDHKAPDRRESGRLRHGRGRGVGRPSRQRGRGRGASRRRASKRSRGGGTGGGRRASRRSSDPRPAIRVAAANPPSRACSRVPYPVPIVPRPRTSLVAAAAVAAALAAPAAASAADYPGWAPDVPWGAGCEPAQSPATRTAANCGATLVEGEAVPPPNAPPVVKRVIAAANEIDNTPYIWGGGHASFEAKGYDCSGAVSYALHGAEPPLLHPGIGPARPLRRPRPRQMDHHLRQRRTRLHGRSRPPLRHPQRPRTRQRPPLEDGRPRSQHPAEVRGAPPGRASRRLQKHVPRRRTGAGPRLLPVLLAPDPDVFLPPPFDFFLQLFAITGFVCSHLPVLGGEPRDRLLRFLAEVFGVDRAGCTSCRPSVRGRICSTGASGTASNVLRMPLFGPESTLPARRTRIWPSSSATRAGQLVAVAADQVDGAFERFVEQRRPGLRLAVDRFRRALAFEQHRFGAGLVEVALVDELRVRQVDLRTRDVRVGAALRVGDDRLQGRVAGALRRPFEGDLQLRLEPQLARSRRPGSGCVRRRGLPRR